MEKLKYFLAFAALKLAWFRYERAFKKWQKKTRVVKVYPAGESTGRIRKNQACQLIDGKVYPI